jgi:hypothetical protein
MQLRGLFHYENCFVRVFGSFIFVTEGIFLPLKAEGAAIFPSRSAGVSDAPP